MRSHEFITESAESLNTYLTLKGYSIDQLEDQSTDVIAHYEAGKISKDKMKNYLISINLKIINLVNDPDIWDRFNDDPEVGIVYDRNARLANSNYDYLTSKKD